jgi:tetratricopeptide (TPR) repeat protein
MKIIFHLARSYSELNQTQEVISVYKTATLLHPKNEYFYLNLAANYFSDGKLELAIQYYQQVLLLNPKNTMAYRNVGLCFKYESIEHEL